MYLCQWDTNVNTLDSWNKMIVILCKYLYNFNVLLYLTVFLYNCEIALDVIHYDEIIWEWELFKTMYTWNINIKQSLKLFKQFHSCFLIDFSHNFKFSINTALTWSANSKTTTCKNNKMNKPDNTVQQLGKITALFQIKIVLVKLTLRSLLSNFVAKLLSQLTTLYQFF